MRTELGAGYPSRSWQIGEAIITSVIETPLSVPLDSMPRASHEYAAAASWISPACFGSNHELEGVVQAFIVETGGARIVIDPCVGNGRRRSYGPLNMLRTDFLDRMIACGFAPESIDVVVSTHLHWDHFGWNTRRGERGWEPTFPRARYCYSRYEWDAFMGGQIVGFQEAFADSFKVIEEASLIDLVDVGSVEIAPNVRLVPSPGHSIAHACVTVESAGVQALISGDAFHHQLQIAEPEWSTAFDDDPACAAATRLNLVDQLVDRDITVFGTHFKDVVAGRVVSSGSGLRFVGI